MSDQPTDDLTDEQQSTMDGVEHAIDEARQAQSDLRAVDAGAMHEPADDPLPDAPGPEA